jgi:phosphate starvation-inducible PhoH-like protein
MNYTLMYSCVFIRNMPKLKSRATLDSFEELEVGYGNRNGVDKLEIYQGQKDKIKDRLHIKDLKWTEKQKKFINLALDDKTKIVFISGPAGTSKTMLSVYCGLRLLNSKKVSDMVYVRSAVESSDARLGFLPGDADTKLHYFNMPFMDKLDELLSDSEVKRLQKESRVSTYPINFSRGMSWNEKCLILDECQNSSLKEIVTFLTRIGHCSKIFICADPMQTDLKNGNRGGFKRLNSLFNDEESNENGIFSFEFNEEDIVRSEILKYLVKRINTLE